jgi:hypothetical protein
VPKHSAELETSSKPSSWHVWPGCRSEYPGPSVALVVDVVVAEVIVLEAVVDTVEDLVVVKMPGQMYLQVDFACVSEPVARANRTLLSPVS